MKVGACMCACVCAWTSVVGGWVWRVARTRTGGRRKAVMWMLGRARDVVYLLRCYGNTGLCAAVPGQGSDGQGVGAEGCGGGLWCPVPQHRFQRSVNAMGKKRSGQRVTHLHAQQKSRGRTRAGLGQAEEPRATARTCTHERRGRGGPRDEKPARSPCALTAWHSRLSLLNAEALPLLLIASERNKSHRARRGGARRGALHQPRPSLPSSPLSCDALCSIAAISAPFRLVVYPYSVNIDCPAPGAREPAPLREE